MRGSLALARDRSGFSQKGFKSPVPIAETLQGDGIVLHFLAGLPPELFHAVGDFGRPGLAENRCGELASAGGIRIFAPGGVLPAVAHEAEQFTAGLCALSVQAFAIRPRRII